MSFPPPRGAPVSPPLGASAQAVTTGAILFTDMVDSTSLRTKLGEVRADLLRKQHDDLLARTIAEHRGVVARWTGDGVKAVFSTASDAVAAAVDIQRAVIDYSAGATAVAPFQVRVGLSIGEVTIDESGDRRGVAVVEAARLEALARPGEILATDMVRMLGHRRSHVTFEEVGERTLKGLDRAVLVHRVIDVAAGVAPPIPRLLSADRHVPMVGRDRHVDDFRERWNDARSGTAGLILVRGQAGIGKTRLVSQWAEIAHDAGAIVLGGACSSDVGVPYEPFAMAFRAVAGIDETLDAAITSRAGSLARLFPGSTSSHSETQPLLARFELFDAVAALVGRLSRTHPILLVVDDLHWATAPTVFLLRHLIHECASQRLMIVATYRAEEVESSSTLRDAMAEVRAGASTTVIDLAALVETDVVEMVRSLAPHAPISRVAEVAQLVYRESAGHPFFASELLQHLAITGHIDRAIGDRLPIPDSVQDVVIQRLARLPAGAHQLLTLAAVIGPSFNVDVLAAVSDRTADDVLDLLDDADRAGVVTEVGVDQFAFVHAIVRTALLEGLSASRTARAHRRVAEALEARGAEQFDELARHWQLAGEESKSTRHLATAARRDMVALAFESAKARYQQVIDLLTYDTNASMTMRAEAWLGLAAASRALGDPSFKVPVARAARLARTVGDPALLAEAASLSTWLGSMFFTALEPDREMIELCEDAIEQLDDSDPMRPRLLAALASHLTFTPAREPRVKLIAEATSLAARHGDPLLTAEVLRAEFACLWEPETLPRREQVARDLGRLARATGDPNVEFSNVFFDAYCLAERGRLPEARERLVASRPIVDATRSEYSRFLAERLVLTIDIAFGEPNVQDRIDDFMHRFGATQADTEGTWMIQSGILGLTRGTFGSMVSAAQAMTAGDKPAMWIAAHALALLCSGDRAGAEQLLDQPIEFPKNYFWLVAMQAWSDVAAGLGRRDHCRRLYDDLVAYRGRAGLTGAGSVCYGLVSRTLGMLALTLDDVEVACDLLDEAVEHADRIGMVFDATISRRLLATALVRQGDLGRVATLLEEALVIAKQHGFAAEIELILAQR